MMYDSTLNWLDLFKAQFQPLKEGSKLIEIASFTLPEINYSYKVRINAEGWILFTPHLFTLITSDGKLIKFPCLSYIDLYYEINVSDVRALIYNSKKLILFDFQTQTYNVKSKRKREKYILSDDDSIYKLIYCPLLKIYKIFTEDGRMLAFEGHRFEIVQHYLLVYSPNIDYFESDFKVYNLKTLKLIFDSRSDASSDLFLSDSIVIIDHWLCYSSVIYDKTNFVYHSLISDQHMEIECMFSITDSFEGYLMMASYPQALVSDGTSVYFIHNDGRKVSLSLPIRYLTGFWFHKPSHKILVNNRIISEDNFKILQAVNEF